eukprot:CAMPEP_0173210152 /NCGR_PEP_ID=MMETSP1141-20130122/23500_1 /TAXON_ID=483371 /ORGANISM="non described non described, Strain CCMP2298" /LENGTH=69 /DNA_ID=CAMNT_0014136857 /DNA_START=229 /DNA_END=435 /DNA_ORIENTATION=+
MRSFTDRYMGAPPKPVICPSSSAVIVISQPSHLIQASSAPSGLADAVGRPLRARRCPGASPAPLAEALA